MSVRTGFQVNVDTVFTGKCRYCSIRFSLVIHYDLVLFVSDSKSILVYGMSTETLLI